LTARTNRDWMHRVVRYVAEQGIDQFLDIGTGIPTEPNLHQVAQGITPSARVVYVDNDPLVLAHARALLVGTPQGRTAYLDADVREPRAILDSPELHETLDLSRPVALSLVALLHFVPEGAHEIVATLLDALAPGSYLAISHVTADFSAEMSQAVEVYRNSGVPAVARDRVEFARFFDGLDLVDPGIGVPHRWHNPGITPPASLDGRVSLYCALARKP
jgi:SAM-dependent methyltransferase